MPVNARPQPPTMGPLGATATTQPAACSPPIRRDGPMPGPNRTPDWVLSRRAAEAGFRGFVVRDKSQLDQLAEMYVLSRLSSLAVVTWRKGVDDPVREWGQLLAYLPELRKRLAEAGGRAILLPNPTLTSEATTSRPERWRPRQANSGSR